MANKQSNLNKNSGFGVHFQADNLINTSNDRDRNTRTITKNNSTSRLLMPSSSKDTRTSTNFNKHSPSITIENTRKPN